MGSIVKRLDDSADRRSARRQSDGEAAEELRRQAEALAVMRNHRVSRGLPPVAPEPRRGAPPPAVAPGPTPSVPAAGPGVPVQALWRPSSGRVRLVIGAPDVGQVVVELPPAAARALAVGILDAIDQGRGRRGSEPPTDPEPEPESEEPS